MDGVIRLDLGAGHKKYPGWTSIDIATERKGLRGEWQHDAIPVEPDVSADLRDLPFPDDFADEARSIHVVEHFPVWEVPDLLAEWVRVIKPGGRLTLECPCLEKIVKLFDVPNIPPAMTFWGLYGDPRYKDELMMHRWCYTERQLAGLMQEAGLVNLRPEPPQFHQPVRDMRIIGTKPKPEPILLAA